MILHVLSVTLFPPPLHAPQMEAEMDQLSRAFGMPSVFAPATSPFDMHTADLPAAVPAMAKSLVSWRSRHRRLVSNAARAAHAIHVLFL